MKSPSRTILRQRADNAPRLAPRFGVIFLVLSLLTTLWSLASPLMSVPDEPAHTIKAAAVARGQFFGTSGETQGEVLNVVVPKYIADVPELACYRFKVNVTADCAPRLNPDERHPTVAGTSAGNYNPLYYLVVGMGSRGISGEPAIYAMRILSGLLTSLFLAATVLGCHPVHPPQVAVHRRRNRHHPHGFVLGRCREPQCPGDRHCCRCVHEPGPRPGQRPGP